MKTKTVEIVKWIAYNKLNGDVSRVYDTKAELDGCYSPNWITMKLSGEANIEIPEPKREITPSMILDLWHEYEGENRDEVWCDWLNKKLFPGYEP